MSASCLFRLYGSFAKKFQLFLKMMRKDFISIPPLAASQNRVSRNFREGEIHDVKKCSNPGCKDIPCAACNVLSVQHWSVMFPFETV